MADFVIYENPGNKAARLERENAQLKAENARLRALLGETTEQIHASHAAISQAPRIPQAQTFQHGACAVTIGARPGGNRPSAIPSLQMQGAQPQAQASDAQAQAQAEAQPGEVKFQIFDLKAGPMPAMAPSPTLSPPANLPAQPRPVRRMVNGQPAGAGGMTQFDLGAMRPVPVKPTDQGPIRPAAPAAPPAIDEAMDDARQRFSMLELDGMPIENKASQG